MKFRSRLILFLVAIAATGLAAAQTKLPPPRHGGIYVVAHRGAHEGIPENTIAAYRKAIELGVDYVEIDLRLTKDGRMVSIHNSTVEDYAPGVTGAVADMTLDELRALDIGSRVGPEWANERIPTFEEILEVCKGKVGIYLDFKCADMDKALEMIRAHGMEREVLWYASPAVLMKLRQVCPECVPMPDPGPEMLLPTLLKKIKPQVVATVSDHFTKSFADRCHEAGAVVLMDEGDPSGWEAAIQNGVDGIQTDHPADLIKFLESRKKE